MADRNGFGAADGGSKPSAELSRKTLLGKAAVLAGGVVAVGFPAHARAASQSGDGVRWNAAEGRFDASFVTTSPVAATDNLIQPTADVPALTLRHLAGGSADLQRWEDATGNLMAAVSEEGSLTLQGTSSWPGSTMHKKGLRVYSTPSGLADPQTYINEYGAFYTRAWMIISGYNSGSESSGTYEILHPTPDPGMLQIWCDTDGPVIQARTSAFSQPPWNGNPVFGVNRTNYLFSGVDRNGSYVFSIEETGELRWGSMTDSNGGATHGRSEMDTNLYRVAAKQLRTDGGLLIQNPSSGGPTNAFELKTIGGMPFLSVAAATGAAEIAVQSDVVPLTLRGGGAGTSKLLRMYDAFTNETMYFTPTRWHSSGEAYLEAGNGLYFDANKGGSGNPIMFRQPYGVQLSWLSNGTLLFENGVGIDLGNGHNIIAGNGAGVKIGTAATQKLGFFDATPVVQRPGHGAQTDGSGYGSRERNMLNDVYAGLRALGLLA